MSMKTLDGLRDKFCEELDTYARKEKLSAGDLEAVHKLTDTIKNIDKIYIMEEDGEYSQAGNWEAHGRFGDYDKGNSYARRGEHYIRGHYSRSDGRRDHMGRYSRADGKEEMMEHIDMMMETATTEPMRDAVRRFKKQLENM